MDGEEGGGLRLSKRFTDKDGGEVDYKTKAGTAWSHSYLNQKPWHPLSYPNQRRKWIAEQTHAQRERRAEEVSREYAQEQEFFRQTALVSQKEKEKMEMMRAVSFMYVRPPGYNAESATAAELAKDKPSQEQEEVGSSMPGRTEAEDKKKPRPKDVFGRALPTEEQFEVLKNAPRLETGVAARSKPFGIEIRNVKCLRCGNFGHQSGDRECPMKDAVMPSEQSRLKRDDPLTAIMAQTDLNEPLKWELKHTPGLSPPRGGFKADDPNQQIVAEDIFDEYGGFLEGGGIPAVLTNFYSSSPKKKSSRKKKNREKSLPSSTKIHDLEKRSYSSDDYKDGDRNLKNKRGKSSAGKNLSSSSSEESDFNKPKIKATERYDANNNKSSSAARDRVSRSKQKQHDRRLSRMSEPSLKEPQDCGQSSSKERERVYSDKKRHKRKSRKKFSESSESDNSERERKSSKRERHRRKSRKASYSSQSDSDYDKHQKRSVEYKYSHRPASEYKR